MTKCFKIDDSCIAKQRLSVYPIVLLFLTFDSHQWNLKKMKGNELAKVRRARKGVLPKRPNDTASIYVMLGGL